MYHKHWTHQEAELNLSESTGRSFSSGQTNQSEAQRWILLCSKNGASDLYVNYRDEAKQVLHQKTKPSSGRPGRRRSLSMRLMPGRAFSHCRSNHSDLISRFPQHQAISKGGTMASWGPSGAISAPISAPLHPSIKTTNNRYSFAHLQAKRCWSPHPESAFRGLGSCEDGHADG